MKRTYKMYVEDILEPMDKIERYIKDLTYETFEKSDIFVDAVIRNRRKLCFRGAHNRRLWHIKIIDFDSAENLQFSSILKLIGEASKNIPENVREKYSDIPWKRMVGLRNIAIHEYFGVDLTIIWEIITRNLPETRSEIESMLDTLE